MKKALLLFSLLALCSVGAFAQKTAKIQFDKTTHHFGTFSAKGGDQKCTFTFKNVGDAPLIIHEAIASCGCTVPQYTKTPVAPGASGKVDITYKVSGQNANQHVKKVITVYTNGSPETVRLTIEGDMVKE